MIYSPADDSFLLQAQVKKYSKEKKVLDMGSGSGILAKTAKEAGAKSVIALDIDEKSVNYLKSQNLEAVKSNLFSNAKGKFDLIIFNPPYLPLDSREDLESQRVTTGGKRGDEIILRFLKKAEEHLEDRGIILLLLSSLTPREKINKLLKSRYLSCRVVASKKLFFEKLEVWVIKR